MRLELSLGANPLIAQPVVGVDADRPPSVHLQKQISDKKQLDELHRSFQRLKTCLSQVKHGHDSHEWVVAVISPSVIGS
jgi:hypothetical protein